MYDLGPQLRRWSLNLFLLWGLSFPTNDLTAECSFPQDFHVVKSDNTSKRLFIEATEAQVASIKKMASFLQRLDRIIEHCEPSWKGKWSASFFSDPKLAGYKTESALSPAVESGDWGKAYVAEYDRKTEILTILPLDSAKRRTRRYVLVQPAETGQAGAEDAFRLPKFELEGRLAKIFEVTDCEYISGITCRIHYNGALPLPSHVFFTEFDEQGQRSGKRVRLIYPKLEPGEKGRATLRIRLARPAKIVLQGEWNGPWQDPY